MTAARFYSNAPATTLPSGCTDSATSITVASITGLPVTYPYTLILDPDTALEEVVTVTAGTGTSLTVTRGEDDTSGLAHSSGAAVIHGVSARDFNELQEHIAGTGTSVHGLPAFPAGTVLGTTDTQTVTNKDLSSGTNTFPSTLVTETSTDTLTNKTLALGSNTVSGTKAQFNTAMTDADFATLTGTETLTNKTVSGPSAAWTAASAASVPVTVNGTTSQSANLISVKNVGGTEIFTVSAAGAVDAASSVATAGNLRTFQDLTVDDDATIAGDLTVTGTINAGAVPYAVSAGTAAVSLVAAAAGSVAVVFPVGRFSVTPIINVTVVGNGSYIANQHDTPAADATGFTVAVRQYEAATATGTVNVRWTAVQMASGSASG